MNEAQLVRKLKMFTEFQTQSGRREVYVCAAGKGRRDGYWIYTKAQEPFDNMMWFASYEEAHLANAIIWSDSPGMGVWHKQLDGWFQVLG